MRKIGLASGVLPDAPPERAIEAAARAGFDAVGIWVDLATWTSARTAQVRIGLASGAISAIDAEVIWLRPGPLLDDHRRILDIAAEIGASNAVAISFDPDRSATADKIAELCEHVAGSGVRVNLEPAPITAVKSIGDALEIITSVSPCDAAVLVDVLHIVRAGTPLAELAALPRAMLSYAQLCDAAAEPPPLDDLAALRTEAVDGRLPLGLGGLPVADLLAVLPADLPLSIEERSRQLREEIPDFDERAKVVARTTRAFLDRYDSAVTGRAGIV